MSKNILDHHVIGERYFFPRSGGFADPFMVETNGVRLGCYYERRHASGKTVVMFHGNGEVVSDYIELYAPVFDKMGYNCFLAEYRGYGMSTGTPALSAMLDDIPAIIEAVGKPHEEIVLFGRSVGSIYALHAAALYPNIGSLIIESGIADVLERLLMRLRPQELGVSPAELQDAAHLRFNHRAKLQRFNGGTLVLHARYDNLVAVDNGQRLYEWANQPKTLQVFQLGDHNDIMLVNYQAYFQKIFQFLSGGGADLL